MSKAEEQALKAYPDYVGFDDVSKTLEHVRNAYVKGYNQAEQDLMEKFKMWVAHNGYTAKDAEVVYNDFKQFIMEN